MQRKVSRNDKITITKIEKLGYSMNFENVTQQEGSSTADGKVNRYKVFSWKFPSIFKMYHLLTMISL